MHLLSTILNNSSVEVLQGELAMEISSLTFDSRNAQKGSLFFAIVGSMNDGHQFIQSAYV
jgi:UDP-N-acetylmuramoyl-L-alanyl-D-glutamate--2,6-diaminopimelate ligase